jgi:hypothetical protein
MRSCLETFFAAGLQQLASSLLDRFWSVNAPQGRGAGSVNMALHRIGGFGGPTYLERRSLVLAVPGVNAEAKNGSSPKFEGGFGKDSDWTHTSRQGCRACDCDEIHSQKSLGLLP